VVYPARVEAGEGDQYRSDVIGYPTPDWDCTTCDPLLQRERGCHLPGRAYTAESAWRIDDTGDKEHDWILSCPVSRASMALRYTVTRYHQIKALGGLAAYYGRPPSSMPARVAWTYAALSAIESRRDHQVARVAASLSRRARA
jgi:hypothetical protein